jgi:hypothetical protein
MRLRDWGLVTVAKVPSPKSHLYSTIGDVLPLTVAVSVMIELIVGREFDAVMITAGG